MPPACVLKVHEGRYGKEETRICVSPKPKGRESKDKKRTGNQSKGQLARQISTGSKFEHNTPLASTYLLYGLPMARQNTCRRYAS